MSPLLDPWRRTVLLAAALVLAGCAAIATAAVGVAGTSVVPTQVAFGVSGGMGGFALAGCGVALLAIQYRRYAAAEARTDLERFARELTAIAETIAAHRADVSPGQRASRARTRRQLRAR